jgi:predicted nucleic acid-binding Zn ribbon protein
MNRRVKRQILIALGIFAAIILVFVAIAQVGG